MGQAQKQARLAQLGILANTNEMGRRVFLHAVYSMA